MMTNLTILNCHRFTEYRLFEKICESVAILNSKRSFVNLLALEGRFAGGVVGGTGNKKKIIKRLKL